MKLLPKMTFPVVARELSQLANRRQTYVLRVGYALIVFAVFLSFLASLMSTVDAMELIGQGFYFFVVIVVMQFVGVYLIVPALVAGAICGERERNTLDLLLITRLRPSAIVLEKLFARVLPVLQLLLFTLPLLSIAYTFGGLNQTTIVLGFWYLLVGVLQIGSLAMFCSAYSQKTSAAFLLTVIIGFFWIGTGPILYESLYRRLWFSPEYLLVFFLPASLLQNGTGADVVQSFLATLPTIFVSVILLFAAMRRLKRELAVQVQKAIKKAEPAAILNRDRRSRVCENLQPVAWLEKKKRSAGWWHLAPAAFFLLCTAVVHKYLVLQGFLYSAVIFSLGLAVRSCGMIAEERRAQTLDIILTTRLTAAEFLTQKMAGNRKPMFLGLLGLVILLPMTVISSATYFRIRGSWQSVIDLQEMPTPLTQICGTLIAAFVFAHFVSWFAVLIGLHERRANRAIVGTVVLLVLWCMVPIISLVLYATAFGRMTHEIQPSWPLLELSPATLLYAGVYHEWSPQYSPWTAILCCLTLHVGLTLAIRAYCLHRAEVLLRSIGETESLWSWFRRNYKAWKTRRDSAPAVLETQHST